jgi:predicted HicB family RNase H-like nuclease
MVKRKRRREENLLVRISAADKLALQQAAAAQDVPAAQLVRKAIRNVVLEAETHK